jgi:hypothetical protein
MTIAKATIAALRDDFSIQQIESRAADLKANATSVGVRMEEGLTRTELTATCQRYFQAVIKNMEQRFSDQVSKLCQVQMFLSLKPDNPNLSDIAEILDVPLDDLETEWRILRRRPGDLASQESLIDLAVSSEKSAMFPAFACAIRRLLLLPIGTATVERSFSAMKRILCDKRNRLLPEHMCHLMRIAIEGPSVPDVRSATSSEVEAAEY